MPDPATASSHVFYRKLTRRYPRIVRGEGCNLFDDAGRRYLDGCGGAFVANLGHGVAEIAAAIGDQARTLGYVNGTAFTHGPVEALADEIARFSAGDLELVYPLGSGSEAVEAALKLARQYWVESGRSAKRKVVTLSPSYHGNTLLALSVSARPHYSALFQDWMVEVVRVPAPYAYRCGCGGEPPYCDACSGAAVEAAILQAGPDSVAAFLAEPVGGSSTGASVPPPGYWQQVHRICRRHDVLFIADEVLTGAGRTGTWSALEPWGVVPDIMTLGKGIAGGYVPLSAVVTTRAIAGVLARGSGSLAHAQTFSHHPVLCAAGVATLRYLREHRLIERCGALGAVLHRRLAGLRGLPLVGDVRGRGLLAGIEFVADPDTREPLPREAAFAETFTQAALDAGLVVWPNVGHADGRNGDLVMLAPPFIVTEDQIDEMVELMARALRVAADRAGATK
ncbi:MAG TPA: aspartate aminotransferase family protein [Gemmatimonadales bacterium]|jgi:adenosylmethionine-8-amino-7-oxononanoate aminotransferase|nr:aspartate aminotransferase family protein [Gemmatimonadales bacterium]